ncbi:MAG TPA: cytochrome c3 family protein [Planctomycetota bacterium]|nr:cytochrome c3 family protein [Planctomycetota bacterium]
MAQIFHPAWNPISRVSIFGGLFVAAALLWVSGCLVRSSYVTEAGVMRDQPIPFSHKHHAGELGIDCRYCHTSVEESSFAGLPPTKTCMNCHSLIWADSPVLEPVRDSFASGQAISWSRVHRLPGYVYFDHSIHLAKGVGCVACHGRVDDMPLVAQQATLYMEWCLDCHRHPEPAIGPREEVCNPSWSWPGDRQLLGQQLARTYHVASRTDCVDCHR